MEVQSRMPGPEAPPGTLMSQLTAIRWHRFAQKPSCSQARRQFRIQRVPQVAVLPPEGQFRQRTRLPEQQVSWPWRQMSRGYFWYGASLRLQVQSQKRQRGPAICFPLRRVAERADQIRMEASSNRQKFAG